MTEHFFIRLKLLLHDKTAVFCYIISMAVMLLIFSGLESVAEDRSAVPIGLINESDSIEATHLENAIKSGKSLYVYDRSLEELEQMLKDGYINSIFIINDDYGEKIRNGISEGLVSVICGKDDKMSVILGNIFAGSMMYDICINKSYNRYVKMENEDKLDKDGFMEYFASFIDRPEFVLPIEYTYVNSATGKADERIITNGMLYRQMIAGMAAMLLCIVAFTSCNGICLEHETGIRRRKNTATRSLGTSSLTDFLAIYIYTLPLALISGIILGGMEAALICAGYLATVLPICFLTARYSGKLSTYQFFGVLIIAGFGATGFISAFSGLAGGGDFLRYTPNGMFIDLMMR